MSDDIEIIMDIEILEIFEVIDLDKVKIGCLMMLSLKI
jgi:hypothetical protein